MIVETTAPLDEKTLEKIRACERAEFPICLEGALCVMFGKDAKKLLEFYFAKCNPGFAKKRFFEKSSAVCTPSDIWQIHEEYVALFAEKFGDDVAYVIENETFRAMESMGCLKCPLSDSVLERITNRKS